MKTRKTFVTGNEDNKRIPGRSTVNRVLSVANEAGVIHGYIRTLVPIEIRQIRDRPKDV